MSAAEPNKAMLRGLYVARLNLKEPHLQGVAAKIRAQAEVLRELPGTVQIVYPSEGVVYSDETPVRTFGRGATWSRLTYYLFFYFVALAQVERVDFLYLRYQGASPTLAWMLHGFRQRNPRAAILMEVPTYPYEAEAITLRAKLFGLIDRLSRHSVFRLVDHVVTFSRSPEIFGVETIRTENGVDVNSFEQLAQPASVDPMRLAGVANVSYWHGFDRVISGLSCYYEQGGRREIHFHIVGTGAELAALEMQSAQMGLQHRVHFHGSRLGSELTEVLMDCHMGVSCLALHRKKSDTSDLKSREYCARGLPFIIGYADRDFPRELPFMYQAPPDDSPLDFSSILAFYDDLQAHDPNHRRRIREYAENRLDWRKKMQPVLANLRDRLNSGVVG